MEKILKYTVIYEPAEEGGYIVHVPALPGCHTEGDTMEEARAMAQDAIACYLESLQKDGLPFPEDVFESEQLISEKMSVAL